MRDFRRALMTHATIMEPTITITKSKTTGMIIQKKFDIPDPPPQNIKEILVTRIILQHY